MTIDEAVKVLNEHRHRGCAKWDIDDGFVAVMHGEGNPDFTTRLTEYEAVAVAMRYVQEDCAEMALRGLLSRSCSGD